MIKRVYFIKAEYISLDGTRKFLTSTFTIKSWLPKANIHTAYNYAKANISDLGGGLEVMGFNRI